MNLTALYLTLALTGFAAGHLAFVCACWLLADTGSAISTGCKVLSCRVCGRRSEFWKLLVSAIFPVRCSGCGARRDFWPVAASCSTAILFAMFGWFLISYNCQTVTEVRPSHALWEQRLPYHLLLIFLLLIVTITDLLDYSVPDFVVLPGTVLAILLATASGELQIIHVWVNWDAELADLYGPDLPDWMKNYQHLHGLVWSLAGAVTGAGLIWLVRIMARGILGYPAIGFGDVTLMAMIGAFLGWQPTLCALAIAPVGGILIGLLVRLVSGKNFVAFGPYLAFAAVLVLFTWRLLWEQFLLRNIFSHWPTVAGLVAGSLLAISLLLGCLRFFRSLPVDSLKR